MLKDTTRGEAMLRALTEYTRQPDCPAGKARHSVQAVGVELIRRLEPAGGSAQVSITSLCSSCGLQPRTVLNALQHLQDANLIDRVPQETGAHLITWK